MKILLHVDDILERFKNDVLKFLGDSLVCLLHHGSRAKGEARPDSDYDSVIVTKRVTKEIIKSLQDIFSNYPHFSFYLLSLDDLETMPRDHYLEFQYAKPLYGKLKIKLPTKEEVVRYLNHKRRDILHIIRHTIILPHSIERKAKLVYFSLKDVYVYLSYLAFSEAGKLPPTRKQTILYYKKRKRHDLGTRLLLILDNWDSYREDVARNPEPYLLLLEEFFRKSRP